MQKKDTQQLLLLPQPLTTTEFNGPSASFTSIGNLSMSALNAPALPSSHCYFILKIAHQPNLSSFLTKKT